MGLLQFLMRWLERFAQVSRDHLEERERLCRCLWEGHLGQRKQMFKAIGME